MQSQSWTSPKCVPTPKTLELGLEEQLVTRSLELSQTSLTTLEFPAFQRYTLLLSPTASRLEADQSIRLRQKSSQSAGASKTFVGILLIFLYLVLFLGMWSSGKLRKPLEKRCLQSFYDLFSSLQLRQHKVLPIFQEILVGKCFNVFVLINVAIAKNFHFVDFIDCHSSAVGPFDGLSIIFLFFHPLKIVIKEVFSRARHFSNGEETISDVFHGFFLFLLPSINGVLQGGIQIFV